MLIVILCFSTTVSAVEDRMTDKGSRIAPSVIDIHKGVMLVGGATELSPMLKKGMELKVKDRGSVSPGESPSAEPRGEEKVEKGKTSPSIETIPEGSISSPQKSPATSVKKHKMSITFFAPKLEVRKPSGWSNSTKLLNPQILTFRWLIHNTTNAKEARVEIRESGQLKSSKILKSIPKPGHFQQFSLDYFRNVPPGEYKYTVRVILLDKLPTGTSSNPVTVSLKASATIKLVGIQPASVRGRGASPTVIHGAKQGEPLNDFNSIKITYQYDCNTHHSDCKIGQDVWVSHHDGTESKVAKGKGFTTTRFTIRCINKDQPDTFVKKIEYYIALYCGLAWCKVSYDVYPVNYIFTCTTSKEKKKKASQIRVKPSP